MELGKIIGTVIATRKNENLIGSKLMIIEPVSTEHQTLGPPFVAVDTVGSGVGEIIIFARGTAARNAACKPEASIDAAIIGIVDSITTI